MKKIIKNILIFISYFIYSYAFKLLAYSFNINYYALDIKNRIIFTLITSMIYLLIIIFLYRKELKEELKDFKFEYIYKNIIFYFIGIVLMALINTLLTKLTNQHLSGNEIQIREYINKYPIYMIFSTVIFAPIIEELMFRKSLKNIFKFKYLFIILSGLIFGIAHITNFKDVNELLFSIPYIIMGIDFAYIYYRTNNIFTTITFHLCHNLILLIIQIIL